MFVCPQDILVLLSCRSQQTKNSVRYTHSAIILITPLLHFQPVSALRRLAHTQGVVSLLSGCHVMYLSPYCAGVTQYIFSFVISPRCDDLAQRQAKDYRLVVIIIITGAGKKGSVGTIRLGVICDASQRPARGWGSQEACAMEANVTKCRWTPAGVEQSCPEFPPKCIAL